MPGATRKAEKAAQVRCSSSGSAAISSSAGSAFLASPRASYITGAVLPVSGGLGLGLYPEQLG